MNVIERLAVERIDDDRQRRYLVTEERPSGRQTANVDVVGVLDAVQRLLGSSYPHDPRGLAPLPTIERTPEDVAQTQAFLDRNRADVAEEAGAEALELLERLMLVNCNVPADWLRDVRALLARSVTA